MLTLLLQLLLAHLIGDFVLQPNKWVEHKKSFKIKSKYLYFHAAIHLMLLLLITAFKTQYLLGIMAIVISHLVIDILKIYLEKPKYSKAYFFTDQFLHFLVLAVVVYAYYPYEVNVQYLQTPQFLLIVTALLSVSYVSAIVLRVLLTQWSVQIKQETSELIQHNSNHAGKYIGILERLFIFFFVVINFWEGIGFLLAAKSIFRFGDLKDAKDIKLTEYILIGTLLSFGMGILCAELYLAVLKIL
ncbi:DUF3307 domain-containing protein [Pedobacter puniceum]|jgi:hypothetical protein|uniref:DUF3307 domain-containing protein n=1 Tax=Pedobacter puniceum TaxID=2666136 RepID=A0A7K0FKR6_9SPHI|nr:DUF3307 domain-containing protein [Pedobacter puniceum]MRX46503.1 DUF3307 domain-containing protein [Pedobacter puniceum]